MEQEYEYESEGYAIVNDNEADYALEQIAIAKEEYDRLTAIADEKISELKAKKEQLQESYDKKVAFYRFKLQQFFETVPHKETKTQESYKLLSGSLVKKKAAQKIVNSDENSLISWLKANNEESYIKTEEKVSWGEFKKNLSIVDGKVVNNLSGEVVDCVSIEETEESFDIKL